MQPIRLAIALILLGGLVLLTVQNLSPALPLVILGGSTQSLPLAVWIGGSIAAGAVTTLVLSALSSLARPVRRSAPKRPAAAVGTPFQTPWTPQPSGKSAQTGSAQAKSNRRQNDWDAPQGKDEWDDWEEPAPPAAPSATQSRAPQPEIRDRLDEDWADWNGYDEFQRYSERNEPQRNEPQRNEPQTPYVPRRIDFEAKQEPVTRIQSGSVYSHSYNRAETPADRRPEESFDRTDDPHDRSDPPPRKTGDVYDAEYRVLTPPYHPSPEPPVNQTPVNQTPVNQTPVNQTTESINPFDLDDWDFEEDSLDSMEPDEPTERHDRRPIL